MPITLDSIVTIFYILKTFYLPIGNAKVSDNNCNIFGGFGAGRTYAVESPKTARCKLSNAVKK